MVLPLRSHTAAPLVVPSAVVGKRTCVRTHSFVCGFRVEKGLKVHDFHPRVLHAVVYRDSRATRYSKCLIVSCFPSRRDIEQDKRSVSSWITILHECICDQKRGNAGLGFPLKFDYGFFFLAFVPMSFVVSQQRKHRQTQEARSQQSTMADLFHLDDELDHPEDELEEEEVIGSAVSPVDVDVVDEPDREIVDLPPDLAHAAKQKTVELGEDDRLDLQDFAVKGSLQEREEYSQLQHWWVQELQAPELLPWDGQVMAPMMGAAFSEEEEYSKDNANNLEAILNDIRCVDKERVQFVVANLLQMRLRKIQACPWFYKNNKDRLSNGEVSFLFGLSTNLYRFGLSYIFLQILFLDEFYELLEGHLQKTVTNHFPQEAWKRLDEPEMIEKPRLDEYVMVRVFEDCTLRKGSEEARTLEEGSNLIVNYREVRTFLESGALQLIM